METAVCYRHKESRICLDMKYLKEHKDKVISISDWRKPLDIYKYKTMEIPFSDDWEVEIRYFEPSEVHRALTDTRLIDEDLRKKLYKIIDFK